MILRVGSEHSVPTVQVVAEGAGPEESGGVPGHAQAGAGTVHAVDHGLLQPHEAQEPQEARGERKLQEVQRGRGDSGAHQR